MENPSEDDGRDDAVDATERRFHVREGLLADGFTMLPNGVLRRTDLSGNAKALYAILLDVVLYQQEEPSLDELGHLLGGGAKTARTALAALVTAKLLKKTRRGQGHADRYELLEPAPFQKRPEGTSKSAEREQPSMVLKTLEDFPPVSPPALSGKVDRVSVSKAESELAPAILAAYNELTGQSFGGRDWLAKIVMRLREHPELGLDDHRRVLEVALAAPWWDGRPAPNVVYGNAALFERCLDAALAAPLRNGAAAPKGGQKYGRRNVSADEFEALADRLKAEAEREGRKELESG